MKAWKLNSDRGDDSSFLFQEWITTNYFLKTGLKPRFSLAGEISRDPLLHDLPLRSYRFHRVWKGGSWSRIPAPFSRESRIPHVFHQFPESRFSFPEKYIKKV